ncbi:MAG: cell division protein SepF, partial [Clostridiales bacterium]|nr:cell division protein SepF [Clostridiales bacterium]
MANIFGKLKNYMLGGEEEYEDDADYEEYEDVVDYKEEKKEMSIPAASNRATRAASASKYDSKIVNIHTNVQMQVVISYPQTVDDAGAVCDYIKSNKTVVVNLENTKHDIAQRVVD